MFDCIVYFIVIKINYYEFEYCDFVDYLIFVSVILFKNMIIIDCSELIIIHFMHTFCFVCVKCKCIF